MKTVIISNFHIKKLLWIILRRLWIMIICAVIAAGSTYILTKSMRSVTYYNSASFFVSNASSEMFTAIENGEVIVTKNDYLATIRMINSVITAIESDAVLSMVADRSDGMVSAERLIGNVQAYQQSGTVAAVVGVFSEDPNEAYSMAYAIAEHLPEAINAVLGRGQIYLYEYPRQVKRISSTSSNKKYVILGGAAGFGIPLVISLIIGLRNPIICFGEEIEFCTGEEVIGTLKGKKKRRKKNKDVDLFNDKMDIELRNSYSILRARLFNEMNITEKKIVFFVSPDENINITHTVLNIALSITDTQRNVLLSITDPHEQNMEIMRPGNLTVERHINGTVKEGQLRREFLDYINELKTDILHDAILVVLPPDEILIRAMLAEQIDGIYIGFAKAGISSMVSHEEFISQFSNCRNLFGGYVLDLN